MDMQVQITHLDDAHEQVDHAIAEALRQQKPVYISISCNIAGIPHSTFDEVPVPFAIEPKLSNPRSATPPARMPERCCPQHFIFILCTVQVPGGGSERGRRVPEQGREAGAGGWGQAAAVPCRGRLPEAR